MANLEELVKDLPQVQVENLRPDLEVQGIAYDSRKVKPGDLFVSISGFRYDGHDFAPEAVRSGAVAVLGERILPGLKVPQVIVPDSRKALGLVSAKFWQHPSRHLRVIGVTGTNGKTTTTFLVKSVLERAGLKTGLIGTIKNMIGSEEIKSSRTTPEASDLQELFARMLEAGVTHVVMEVSSHAVTLKRIVGTEFDIGIFTNITQDHLDFHENFENYLAAKAKFFAGIGRDPWKTGPKAVIVNADDPASSRIIEESQVDVLTYGLSDGVNLRGLGLELNPNGTKFHVEACGQQAEFSVKFLGEFNVYNCLAAIGVGLVEGLDLATIKEALEATGGVRGRAELVDEGQDFAVVIDYAHTPDGLENILETARAFTAGRLWVVFGCGGDRDRTKRPKMGRIAGELADFVVVTSDNPRSEEPAQICADIVEGLKAVTEPKGYKVIVDRRDAIKYALEAAEAGDVVVIAGKGHEDYQVFKDKIIHFDDREEAAEILRALREENDES
ncbi:MAG: UDP-N-acetylmuramoyl-L-alanyl-D-glutamate--2,6-diaminopimelate ligase [Firmicutes bacterium]|nr:UDP-N-acetylmuramoyl-L-alanyl-D-glutamate--2,6-diaminopimelate ligase [Bacillota bacterium]